MSPIQPTPKQAEYPAGYSDLSPTEKDAFKGLVEGGMVASVIERLMEKWGERGKPFLTNQVFELTQRYLAEKQGAKTPFEELLIQQILLCHCRYLNLTLCADDASSLESKERYLALAHRELNQIRKLMMTYQSLNGGRNFTVVNAQQANIAATGHQQVNNIAEKK